MEEFIARIGPYLSCLLSSEGVPDATLCQSCTSSQFEWKHTDCFPSPVLCAKCCRDSHQGLPFHRVQKWTGKYFMPSWLQEVGISLKLGHSGDLCPVQRVGSCDEHNAAANISFGNSKPGRHDKEGNPILTIVDRSGIHEIGVSWCCCPEAPEHNMQLMMAGLFPAMVCRQWRALISQKQFGFGYNENEEEKPGSMAVFCALCTQPGINLPEDWRDYENSKILFMQGFMMDGNFKAEHMKMRNPKNNIPLSEGTGFMVSRGPYELHLQGHDHHAVNSVNKHSGHLESTGIGATACIHGAFVPNSVVDFQKGESLWNRGHPHLLQCHVTCQWSIHMMERVNGSSYLKLHNLELRLAIGLFHIHGHQDTCLARYSPSFIKGR
ncbi:hypothetical protein V8E53_004156 [Lactarius tabidus]